MPDKKKKRSWLRRFINKLRKGENPREKSARQEATGGTKPAISKEEYENVTGKKSPEQTETQKQSPKKKTPPPAPNVSTDKAVSIAEKIIESNRRKKLRRLKN